MRLGAAVNESGPAPALLEHIQIAVGWEKGRGRWDKNSLLLPEVYEPVFLGLSHLPWTVNQQQLLVLLFPWTKCKSQICDLKGNPKSSFSHFQII